MLIWVMAIVCSLLALYSILITGQYIRAYVVLDINQKLFDRIKQIFTRDVKSEQDCIKIFWDTAKAIADTDHQIQNHPLLKNTFKHKENQ